MANKHETPELLAELRERLDYDPETGVFVWKDAKPEHFSDSDRWSASSKCKAWNARHSGEIAGSYNSHGYLILRCRNIGIRCHRLAYAFIKGNWPIYQIDHDNGVRNDNRFADLFDKTNAQNSKNQKLPSNNSSGHVGVKLAPSGRFQAYIKFRGKGINLGLHNTFDEAVATRKAAEVKYGFHPNHGRKT